MEGKIRIAARRQVTSKLWVECRKASKGQAQDSVQEHLDDEAVAAVAELDQHPDLR